MAAGAPGAPGAAGPGGAPAPAEHQDLTNKSDAELQQMLNDPNLSKEEKQEVLDEIAKRKGAKEADGPEEPEGGQGEGGDTEELMKKLKDGTITDEELKQLAEKLGVSEDQLKELKGGGGAGGGGEDPKEIK